jgi:predicted DCC family thiol-disulfide oxidoreductase YuxK
VIGLVVVYYDGWCPLCTAIRTRLERLDWLGRLRFVSIREPGVEQESGIPLERLAKRMAVRWPESGRTAEGIDAVAAIAARVPALILLWPFVKVASLTPAGQALYDYIASRRAIVPVGNCEDGACSIHRPEK